MEAEAWMSDIVGYGQFVDGKLVACSQTEIQISLGSKNIECRPLFSLVTRPKSAVAIRQKCDHKWVTTQHGHTYMDCKCELCGATKRESWD